MAAALLSCGIAQAQMTEAPPSYHSITATMVDRSIVLTGEDMTIEQVVDIARYGAKVELSPEARQRQNEAFGLIRQASTEGVAIYGFNRGAGSGREVSLFTGDPLAPENRDYIYNRRKRAFRAGAQRGIGPEVSDEEIVRALMAVRANTMVYEAASPGLSQILVDMLNSRVTPAVYSRGSLGEADLSQMANVLAVMGGEGFAYYQGERMTAAQALEAAGLSPLEPLEAVYTSAFFSTNAYAVGQAALLVAEGRAAIDWADLIYAMDLAALNSSVMPLTSPVQANRPFKWLNLDAARVLDMLRGSYLFDDDPQRIIQDPVSMRASYARQGSAWKAWATLRDTVLLQINSSDQNPAVLVGVSPEDSWELNTPQAMKYYVRGGEHSNGQSGFIFSNANWDPYPMANEIEAFTNALANMDVAVVQRIYRFGNPFFTVVSPEDVLTPEQRANAAPWGIGYDPTAIWQEIQILSHPLTPEGVPVSDAVEELQAQTFLKVTRARAVVRSTMRLLAQDLMTAAYWMDIRKIQDPSRRFGEAPTASWEAFRQVMPWQQAPADRPLEPPNTVAYRFLMSNSVDRFYPPAADHIDAS